MFPNLPERNQGNQSKRDAVVCGDRFQCSTLCSRFANRAHLSFSQFGVAVTRASWSTLRTSHSGRQRLAVFRHHIRVVGGGVSEKQMVWPNAVLDIAHVQDHPTVRNVAVGQLIRKPVCVDRETAQAEYTVSVRIVSPASPQPTGIGFIDSPPEASGRSDANCLGAASTRAVVPGLRGESPEAFTARQTQMRLLHTGIVSLAGVAA